MNVIEWSFVIIWPVLVVVLNNLLADQQLKHAANVTCDNFNKTGRVLATVLESIKGIEEALGKHGIEIAETNTREVAKTFDGSRVNRPPRRFS